MFPRQNFVYHPSVPEHKPDVTVNLLTNDEITEQQKFLNNSGITRAMQADAISQNRTDSQKYLNYPQYHLNKDEAEWLYGEGIWELKDIIWSNTHHVEWAGSEGFFYIGADYDSSPPKILYFGMTPWSSEPLYEKPILVSLGETAERLLTNIVPEAVMTIWAKKIMELSKIGSGNISAGIKPDSRPVLTPDIRQRDIDNNPLNYEKIKEKYNKEIYNKTSENNDFFNFIEQNKLILTISAFGIISVLGIIFLLNQKRYNK